MLKFTIVNLITLTRVFGAIYLPMSYFSHGLGYFALFICLVFFTDFIDGKLSRKWEVESFLGSLLDSVADKLFALVVLAVLAYEYKSVLIVLFCEVYILVTGILAFNNNKNIKSSKTGKTKTFILDASVSIMYIFLAKNVYAAKIPLSLNNFLIKSENNVIYILIGIMIGMEFLTIADYSIKRYKQVSYKKNSKKITKDKKEILWMLVNREFYINNRDKALKELLYK